MKTKRISREIETAAELLREGSLVAVPTETVYGLAGNGLDAQVIESIYEVKGRPAVKRFRTQHGRWPGHSGRDR